MVMIQREFVHLHRRDGGLSVACPVTPGFHLLLTQCEWDLPEHTTTFMRMFRTSYPRLI